MPAKSPAADLAAALVGILIPGTLPAGSIVAGPEMSPDTSPGALAVRVWVRVRSAREVSPFFGRASKKIECTVEFLVLSPPEDYGAGEALAFAVRDALSTVPVVGYFFILADAEGAVPTDAGKDTAGRWRFPVCFRVQYTE